MCEEVTAIYECGICGKAYDTISERCECEQKCLEKFRQREKQNADSYIIIKSLNRFREQITDLAIDANTITDLLNSYEATYGNSFMENNKGFQIDVNFIKEHINFLQTNFAKYLLDDAELEDEENTEPERKSSTSVRHRRVMVRYGKDKL